MASKTRIMIQATSGKKTWLSRNRRNNDFWFMSLLLCCGSESDRNTFFSVTALASDCRLIPNNHYFKMYVFLLPVRPSETVRASRFLCISQQGAT